MDRIFSQYLINLKLLWNSIVNPDLSVYVYLYGPYIFNKHPMAPPGTRVIVHNKPGNCTSWAHNFTRGWYISPSLENYRFIQCYMSATGMVIITDTLQYIQKEFSIPNTTTEYYLQQTIGDIISILKEPPNTPPFFSYHYAKKFYQSDYPYFAKNHISALHANINITPNVTTEP